MARSAVPRRWQLRPAPSAAQLAPLNDYPPLLARVLYQRGLTSAEAAERFLNISWENRLDPFLLKDMDRAVDRVRQAVERRERVVVYGDFDTDGVTGVTLLMQLFTALGVQVRPYIPLREGEGYGLHIAAIEKLHAEGIDLLVTVDCGVSNFAEVRRAAELGYDVVVLDHHQPPALLPPAVAVVDPKRADCPYPFKGLCGVGVAFKLFEGLWQVGVRPANLRARDILDVVALGTIADMMPLTGENRVLVHYGLQAMNMTERPGLLALFEVAKLERGQIDSTKVGFGLSPRINAAGRLEDASMAYSLLLAPDTATARDYATQLDTTNQERRTLMLETQEAARELVLKSGQHEQRIMVVVAEGFHHGVVGLAAGRLVEEFCRPVLVMGREEHTSRGSARSVPGFNIVEALAACADLFVKYGGHAAAAGFTIANDRLPELEQRLRAFANAHLTDEMLVPQLTIDTEATFDELTLAAQSELERLAPFGQENPRPLLLTRQARVLEVRPVGSEGRHLKLKLGQGRNASMPAIAFGQGHWMDRLRYGTLIDLVYTPEINEWKGTRSVQLNVTDLRLSEGEAG
ncbi:MAG TPA: single-stranded-DNA-specific exonuclease RecJ [Herpetosiphonaceae bacterium]